MTMKKLKFKDKKRIFEMVAALALIAGEEMSPEGFDVYNDTVIAYLSRYGLLEDFTRMGRDSGLGEHPNVKGSGFC